MSLKKNEITKNPEVMKLALKLIQIKYVVKAFEESLPIVSDPLAKFESDHMERISKISFDLKKEDKYKIAIGAHSLEKSVGNTLAISNIIVVTTFLDQIKEISGFDNYRLGNLGKMAVENVKWAKGVRAASNYVRHLREWHMTTSKFSKIAGEFVSEKIQNIFDLITRNDTKNNVQTLISLGFDAEDILERGSNISFRICKNLDLTDTVKTLEHFRALATDVSDNLESDFANS